jgi:type IV pilus assembly protein PilV
MPPEGRRKEGGFTLIEVMIAMLLLLIGVAGVLRLQMVSVRATSFSRHATEATIVAEDKMEELMSLDGSIILTGPTVCAPPGGPVPCAFDTVDEKAVDDPAGEYTRTWTSVASIVNPGTQDISVTVGWTERGNEPHSIVITSQRRP